MCDYGNNWNFYHFGLFYEEEVKELNILFYPATYWAPFGYDKNSIHNYLHYEFDSIGMFLLVSFVSFRFLYISVPFSHW